MLKAFLTIDRDSQTQQQAGGLGASIPVVTGGGTSTLYDYSSMFNSPTSALSAASATSSASSSSSVQVPVVIGIVVAVIAGLVGIVFAVTYFMVSTKHAGSNHINSQAV